MHLSKVIKTIKDYKISKGTKFNSLDKISIQQISIPIHRIKQDEFGEAFFPTVHVPNNKSEVTFKSTYEPNICLTHHNIPFRSFINIKHTGVSVEEEVVIEKYVKTLNKRLSKDAVETIVYFAESLKIITENGLYVKPNHNVKGISGILINCCYEPLTFDIKHLKNKEDFKRQLVMSLKEVTSRVYYRSGYQEVFTKIHPGVKPTILIGCSPEVKDILNSGGVFELGYNFNIKIVTSTNRKIKNKMFATFTLNNEVVTEDIDPLEVGFCSCNTNITLVSDENESMCLPEYKHTPMLPILIEADIKQ